MQTALIAGCGYLGKRLAAEWLRAGWQVFSVTRSSRKAAEFREQGIVPIEGDLTRSHELPPLPQASIIVWAVGFDASPGTTRQKVWLDGLTHFVSQLACQPAPQKFIQISSTSVYGNRHGEFVGESHVPSPESESAAVCLQAEELVKQLCRDRFPELQTIILRLAGIYGPGRLLRRADDLRQGLPLNVAPDEWLNLIHVDDAVRAILAAAQRAEFPPLLNVVNSGTLTRRQYYTRLAELCGAPEPTFAVSGVPHPTRSGNKRVISELREGLQIEFLYDDVSRGLEQAWGEQPQ